MTPHQLQTIEAELQRRGYKKWTRCLISNESWAWFKTFAKRYDDDGEVVSGYQIAFRVWDYTKYGQTDQNAYGFRVWTSPLGIDGCMDLESRWKPICDIDTFEAMATDFHEFAMKYETKLSNDNDRLVRQ